MFHFNIKKSSRGISHMVRDIEIPIMEETYGQNPKKS